MSTVTVENLALSQIVPSTTNPRKSFDQVALEQLAESIKEIGVTVPILVRPKKKYEIVIEKADDGSFGAYSPELPGVGVSGADSEEHARVSIKEAVALHLAGLLDDGELPRYELVSGHRRLKAAAIAGLETIPAFIRELSDAEALDIQMVENLQRADLHPMDEAAGYQALIDAAADRGVALTQEELAHKVGKPLSYVAQRVKLLDLTETPRKVFQEGHINIGHALILARLTPALQDQGLRAVFDPNRQWVKEKDTAAMIAHAQQSAKSFYGGPREAARPATELKNWVKSNVELDLFEAPWDLGDENLVPAAGSCVACPKRSGNNPALFAELTTGEEKCTDPDCFDLKAKTFVQIKLKAETETGKPMLKLTDAHSNTPLDGTEKVIKAGQWVLCNPKECSDARQGVQVSGSEMGKVMWVCINQKCKKHKHTVYQPQQTSSSSQPKLPKGVSQEEHKAQLERIAKRAAAERMALYMSIRAEYAKINRDTALVEFVVRALDGNNSEDPSMAFELNNWEKTGRWDKDNLLLNEKVTTLKGKAFVSYLFDLMYSDLSDADGWRDFSKELKELTDKYDVDTKAVLAKVRTEHPELYVEPKPKEGKAAAPKKGAKSKSLELSPEGKQRVADAIKKAVASRAKPTGKSAAANDLDDEDLDKLATALADTSTDEVVNDAAADASGCPDCHKHWRDCDCDDEDEHLEAEPDEEEDEE